MIYRDRAHAGQILSKKLQKLKLDWKNSLVVAIPRGGVVIGREIAQKFKVPLKVVVIKKIGAPTNPELAIGAVGSFGKPVLDEWLIRDLKVSRDWLKRQILKKQKEVKRREKFLLTSISRDDIIGKIVFVVDDGLATGQTAKAAAKMLRQFMPMKLILAVPCASPSTIENVKDSYDEIICPHIASDFWAVGQFYRDFRPVEDEEVKKLLEVSY